MIALRRRHLFEFTDLGAVPRAVRRLTTDYLQTVLNLFRPYARLAPLLARALAATGARRIVDLCSGGSGPLLHLDAALARAGAAVPIVMTDRFPDEEALARARDRSGGRLTFSTAPVDARAVPAELDGLRTLCEALHHFPPDEARAILADAVRRGEPIAAFEVTRRGLAGALATLLVPFAVLALTPLIRPFRWSRLALTYLLPIAPLTVGWDALVSSLRCYTVAELRALAAEAGPGYTWEAGRTGGFPLRVTYLVGWPSSAPTRAAIAPARAGESSGST